MIKRERVLAFVDTPLEAREILKRQNTIILATTPKAQNELAKIGLDYTLYAKLLPNVPTIKRMVALANKFAISWFIDTPMELALKTDAGNLAFYLTSYWTNLLIPFLLSRSVIKNAAKTYRPTRILYFQKRITPDLVLNTDFYILDHCGKAILEKNVPIEGLTEISEPERKRVINSFWKKIWPLGRLLMSLLTSKMHKAEILLYGDKHNLINSISLIKTLSKSFSVQVAGSLLSLDQKLQLLKNGVSALDYDQISIKRIDQQFLHQLLTVWGQYRQTKQYQLLLKKFGVSDIEPAISLGFENYFQNHMTNALASLARAKILIEKVKPKAALLYGIYGKKGLSLALTCQRYSGKVYHLEHGIVPNPVQIHPPIYDQMLVWGNWTFRTFQKFLNEPVEKMRIVGWFLIDNLVARMLESRKAAYFSPSVPVSKLRVLFLTTFDSYNHPRQLKMILDVANALNKLGISELIIRPHPSEPLPDSLLVSNPRLDFKLTWDWGSDLDWQIKRSDLVISEGTTVALRVMFWGKPVLHLVTEGVVDFTNFSRFGAAYKIGRISDLAPAIKQLTSSRKARQKMLLRQKRLLKLFCYKLDGKSGERVVKTIKESF